MQNMQNMQNTQNTISIADFYNNDYVDYASYDNLRKIASLVDGQKNAARKILYTVLEKNIKDKIKVSQLGSKVAEFSEYLHGNLDGVIVNLGQSFAGTNNIPLLQSKGNFGTRFNNEASATRYIFTYGTNEFFDLFKKEDTNVLVKQYFEGEEIEPRFYVPTLPLLVINGSEGVSSGFAQKILPRDPKRVKQYIASVLDGKSPRISLHPFYNGFKGTIEQGDNSAQWLIKGTAKKIAANKVQITEVPVGYELKSYIKVLDDLEDRKIIQSYRDKSEDDNFLFEVTIPSKFLKDWDDEELLNKLKLVKKVTENYTVLDENNKIKVFDSITDVIHAYIDVKKVFIDKRKEYLKARLETDIKFDYSKYIFIKMIVEDELKISKRKKDDIVKDLDGIDKIIMKDNSYDYLLNMAIHSLTEERMAKLEQEIKNNNDKLKELQNMSVNELWKRDL